MSSGTQAFEVAPTFFWRPLLSIALSIFLWISFLYLQRDLLGYSLEHFGTSFFAAMLLQIQLLSIVWIFLLGLMVDFLGARTSLLLFFAGSMLFCVSALLSNHSMYFAQLSLQLSIIIQILLILVALKALAIYSKGIRFCLALSMLFSLFSILLHFKSPALLLNSQETDFSHLALILLGISVVLGGLSYFLWPSWAQEKARYDLQKFRHLLRPFYQIRTWPVLFALGLLLFFSLVFLKLAILYTFPALLNLDNVHEEAGLLLSFGMIVGFFIYSLLFKQSPYIGRIVGLNFLLAILCLLGIGFLSMSEELLWCLVALVGVFLGSIVLLFRGLLELLGAESFATACAASALLGGLAYVVLGTTIFHQLRTVHEAHLMHEACVQLWWIGLAMLAVTAIVLLIPQKGRKSTVLSLGTHAHILEVLGRYYRGELSLASAFWLLSVLGRWILIMGLFWILFFFWLPANAIYLMKFNAIPGHENLNHLRSVDWNDLLKFGLVLSVVGIPVSFFSMVSVWRSGRLSLWIWRYLSRVFVMMVFLRNWIFFAAMCFGVYLHFHPEFIQHYLNQVSSV